MSSPYKAVLSPFFAPTKMVMSNLLDCAHTATQHCRPLMTTLGDKCSRLSVVIAGEQMCVKGTSVTSICSQKTTKTVHSPILE